MKYFVPLSDDQLFSGRDLTRYRLVPYEPDLHLSAVRKRSVAQRTESTTALAAGRPRHGLTPR